MGEETENLTKLVEWCENRAKENQRRADLHRNDGSNEDIWFEGKVDTYQGVALKIRSILEYGW